MGQPGHEVCGRRGDDDQVRFLAEPHVLDLVDVLEDRRGHRVTGQRLEGRRTDEPERGLGGDDVDVMSGLGEGTDEGAGLVGGDPTADPHENPETAVPRRGVYGGVVHGVSHGTPAYPRLHRRDSPDMHERPPCR